MAVEDSLKRLEERLTRLEATLTQQQGGSGGGIPVPGGAVVDPAPWGGGGGWMYPRWPWPPHPVVDPAPWPRPWPWPHPIVDPGPWPTPVVDPAPSPWAGVAASRASLAATSLGRIGPIGDPPPIDVSRFSQGQLESTLHSINAERARLDSMETLIKQQLDRVKQQQKG